MPEPRTLRRAVEGVGDEAVRLLRLQQAVKAGNASRAPERAAQALLFPLRDQGALRSGALAEHLHADPSTISRHVATLLRDGLVRREADPDDGRASLLAITDAGRTLCGQLRAARNIVLGDLLDDWTDDDLADLHRLLARLNDDIAAAVPTLAERFAAAPLSGDAP